MFDEVVLETQTLRVGGLVSSEGANLKVLFGPNEAPAVVIRGKNYQTMKLPSLTLLKRAAPDYLVKLWEDTPHYLIELALDQLAPQKRTKREVAKVLRQEPVALDLDSKKQNLYFAELEERKVVLAIGSKPEKIYEVLQSPRADLPEKLLWLTQIHQKSQHNSKSAKKARREITQTEIDATLTGVPLNLLLTDYVAAAADEKISTPTDFENWVSTPFERAVDASRGGLTGVSVPLRKPRVSAYAFLSLLPDEAWQPTKESEAALAKVRNASFLETLSQNWDKDWQQLPHFDRLIRSKLEIGKKFKPLTAMRVLAAIGKAGIQDSDLAVKLFENVLQTCNVTPDIRRELSGLEQITGIRLSAAIAKSFSTSGLRSTFLVWAFRHNLMTPTEEELAGYSLHDLNSLLRELDVALTEKTKGRDNLRYEELIRLISLVSDSLISGVGDEESLLSALTLQARYPVKFDPERLAKFVIATCNRHQRLQPLGKSLAGSSLAREVQLERDALDARLQDERRQFQHLQEETEAMRHELVEIRKRSLTERQNEQLSSRSAEREIGIPFLKLLARALSIAQEFLQENHGAIGRFEILADQAGLERIGKPGEEVAFNPKEHNDPDEDAQVGQIVSIQSVGYRMENNGEAVVLLRATVSKV